MMGSHGMNFGMSWAWVFWVLLILGAVVVGAVVMKAFTGGRSAHPPGEDHRPRPRDILDERYARGELSTDEYRERLQNLDQGPR